LWFVPLVPGVVARPFWALICVPSSRPAGGPDRLELAAAKPRPAAAEPVALLVRPISLMGSSRAEPRCSHIRTATEFAVGPPGPCSETFDTPKSFCLERFHVVETSITLDRGVFLRGNRRKCKGVMSLSLFLENFEIKTDISKIFAGRND
jgi:hypothetical protein